MAQRHDDLPIMVGRKLRKGLLAGHGLCKAFTKGADLCVVWLSKDYESGAEFDIHDVVGQNALIHFCDRESVQRTVDVLNDLLDRWEEDWG